MKSNTARHLSLATPSVQEALIIAIPALVSSLDAAARTRLKDTVDKLENDIKDKLVNDPHLQNVFRDLRFLLGSK